MSLIWSFYGSQYGKYLYHHQKHKKCGSRGKLVFKAHLPLLKQLRQFHKGKQLKNVENLKN